MKFQPVNRHVWIKVLEDEKEQKYDSNKILLPEDYKPANLPHAICEVIGVADDCNINIIENDKIVVENNMINNVKYNNDIYSIILENYIYGILDMSM